MFVILDMPQFNLFDHYLGVNPPAAQLKIQKQIGHLLELNVRNWIFSSAVTMNCKIKSQHHSYSISSPIIPSLLYLLAVFYDYTWELFSPIHPSLSHGLSPFLSVFHLWYLSFSLLSFSSSIFSVFYSCCNGHLTFLLSDYFIMRPQLPLSVILPPFPSFLCLVKVPFLLFRITFLTSRKGRRKHPSTAIYKTCSALYRVFLQMFCFYLLSTL